MGEKLCRKEFKEHRIKVTGQRLAIYKELSKSFDHPSANKIFQKIRKRFPGISFDTVNRTMLTFAEAGLIRMVEGCGDVRRFDPRMGPHHHLRCIQCHKIIDFRHEAYDNLQVPKKCLHGFKLLSKKVVLEGLCGTCQPKKETPFRLLGRKLAG
jgi:Fur family transcriptional regulator, peroxide stress response regulator